MKNRDLKPDKLQIEIRMLNQVINKNIIAKVCSELEKSSISYIDLIKYISSNKN
jgi:hypothetical protein